jgi:hypothetical protein
MTNALSHKLELITVPIETIGNMVKMKYLHIVWTPCAFHCLHLIMKKIVKKLFNEKIVIMMKKFMICVKKR